MKASNKIFIVGVGGVGSWLTPSLCLLATPDQITVIDGDKLEDKNLNRQLFTATDVGSNKAEAIAMKYGCRSLDRFYHAGTTQHERSDWIFCCVDNNRGRRAVLAACDMHGCQAIFAANETHSAESYLYKPDWAGTQLDPRVYYPEILTDGTGDPMAQAIGCTGQAQEDNPQLVSANFMAAALAQHLFVLWGMEVPKLDVDVIPMLPHKLISNLSNLTIQKVGQPERTE